ncbi:MAG: hypothetical protein HZC13_00030 [Nitrospirae bacterium]|nr:hypothetical protein [Nitrospirota bacterium]
MKGLTKIMSTLFFVGVLGVATVHATPSTTYWTTSTMDVQPYKVWHLGIDNYFTLTSKGASKTLNDLSTDMGLTVGVLPFEKLNLEVGMDYLEGTDYPLIFNFKFGTPEGSLSSGSPGIALGMYGIGTKSNSGNSTNVIHGMIGKTIPQIGRIHVGAYSGDKDVLKSSTGKEEATGFMIGWDRWLVKDKFMLAADYASGKNAVGGGGFGLYWFFAPNASMLMGPVWFNDKGINGEWKWTTQLDVNF